jgi:hypothetical protein
MESVNLYRKPTLKKPFLIAAWPGISNVAFKAASYLRDKLGAEEFGEISPLGFFSPAAILVKDNEVETPEFPQSKFYYWRNKNGGNDLIIFISEAQPMQNLYEFASLVLDVAQRFKVEGIYTFAAAVTSHHPEKPKVWGAATDAGLLKELEDHGVFLKGDYQIRGLNGLLLGVAKERGIPGICLLGETPQYFAEFENPSASWAILQVLIKILGIDIDLTQIREEARQAEAEMERITKETMTEYIDRFTRPIWERGEEESE